MLRTCLAAALALSAGACSLALGEGFTGGDERAPGAGDDAGDGRSSGSSGSAGSSGSGSPLPANGRLLTFEDGALVHPGTGADTVTGAVSLTAGAGALLGKYSLGVNGSRSFATVAFAPTADMFLSFHVRTNRATNARFVRIPFDRPGAHIEVRVDGDRVVGAYDTGSQFATFGNATLGVGGVTRIGVHYHAGTTLGEVELFVASGSGPLDRAGGTGSSDLRATLSSVEIGATDEVAGDGAFDDVRIDTESFGQ